MIFEQLTEQMTRLEHLLLRLSPAQYQYRARYLSGSSVGGHTRHILEILQCALQGYNSGVIDYQNRSRNMLLEQDVDAALSVLRKLAVEALLPDKALSIAGEGDLAATSYLREMIYNVEHTIHHLAIIKVALLEMGIQDMDQNFGMAYSTINYNREQLITQQS